MKRKGKIVRETLETKISVELNLDGTGKGQINTQIPFLDHMLMQMTKHGFLDLSLDAKGDIDIDYHHTIEDVGITLGMLFDDLLGERTGIKRYGNATVPMDEALTTVNLDICGRSHLAYNLKLDSPIKDLDTDLFEDFFLGLVSHAKIVLHINQAYGRNGHHIIESVFKGFGKALHDATLIDKNISGPLSTKGTI